MEKPSQNEILKGALNNLKLGDKNMNYYHIERMTFNINFYGINTTVYAVRGRGFERNLFRTNGVWVEFERSSL